MAVERVLLTLLLLFQAYTNIFAFSRNVTDSRYRFASTFDGKEIQPRQMYFFHWLFGDPLPKANNSSENSTSTKADNLLLFPQNRTKPSSRTDALPIDWTQVLKEFVHPLHPNDSLQKMPIYNEKPQASETVQVQSLYNRSQEINTFNTTLGLRNGKQFYSPFYPYPPLREHGRWGSKRRWQVPHSEKAWYQHQIGRKPVYNIYKGDEERNGFDEIGEADNPETEFYESLQRPYPNRQYDWRKMPSFYKNLLLNQFMEGGMRSPLKEQIEVPISAITAKRNGFDAPVRYYDDYDETIAIERPMHVKNGDNDWEEEEEDEIYQMEPDKVIRRSFPNAVSKPWGRNCNGSQCGRQDIPVNSNNSVTGANNTAAVVHSNATGANNAASVVPSNVASSTNNATNNISMTVLGNTTTESIPVNTPSNPTSNLTVSTISSNTSTSLTPSPGITLSSTVTPTPTMNNTDNSTVAVLPGSITNGITAAVNNSQAFPNSPGNNNSTPSNSTTTQTPPNTSNSSSATQNSTMVENPLDSNSNVTNPSPPISTVNSSTEAAVELPPLPPISSTLNCQCGVQSVTGESTGSVIVRAMANPWVVEIHTRSEHRCAGSLINNKYILTSAKCVHNQDKRSLLVTGGLQVNEPITFTVTKVAIHPKFDEVTLEHDIALLRLSNAVKPSPDMRPICLPIHDSTQYCNTGHLVTWVLKDNGRKKQLHLLQSEVELLNQTTCQAMVNEAGDNSIVPTGAICTRPAGKQNCVGGDIGGPLEVYSGKYSYEQIGLVSWSIGCRSTGFPGVYTDIRHYLRWILFQTQDAEYCREPRTRNAQQNEQQDAYHFQQIM